MHLVHLSFLSSTQPLPPHELKKMILSIAENEDGLEHVAVHTNPEGDPVIGLFLRSRGTEEAEETAAELWQRALEKYPELHECQSLHCEAPPGEDGGT